MEIPRACSSSIQSDFAARWCDRACTAPARCTAPAYKRSFSVSVVFPASGCEMMAKVRRLATSLANSSNEDCSIDKDIDIPIYRKHVCALKFQSLLYHLLIDKITVLCALDTLEV